MMNQPNFPKQQGSGMFDARTGAQNNLSQQDTYSNGLVPNHMMDGMAPSQQGMENANKNMYYSARNSSYNPNWHYNSEQGY